MNAYGYDIMASINEDYVLLAEPGVVYSYEAKTIRLKTGKFNSIQQIEKGGDVYAAITLSPADGSEQKENLFDEKLIFGGSDDETEGEMQVKIKVCSVRERSVEGVLHMRVVLKYMYAYRRQKSKSLDSKSAPVFRAVKRVTYDKIRLYPEEEESESEEESNDEDTCEEDNDDNEQSDIESV